MVLTAAIVVIAVAAADKDELGEAEAVSLEEVLISNSTFCTIRGAFTYYVSN